MHCARASANCRGSRGASWASLSSRNSGKRVGPGFGIVLCVGFELQLRRHVNAETTARYVLALDGELEAIEIPDRAVRNVQGNIRGRITLEIVVVLVLEAVEVTGGRNDVEA